MLKLYSNTSYQQLYGDLLGILDTKNSLFSETWIVIPNHSAKQWLQKSLARDRGVCSQIQFILPLSFHWEILKNVKQSSYDFNVFSADVLTWKIYHFIKNKTKYKFLQHGNVLSDFNLAKNIAQIFLKYNEERPEIIASWDDGVFQLPKEQEWQAEMWLDLLDDLKESSPVQLLKKFNPSNDFSHSPDAIILFATEQLTVLQASTLFKLSQKQDIHVMLSNPCPDFYWFNLKELKSQQRKELFEQEMGDIIDVGNPLLASLGRNKMAIFDAFLEESETQEGAFEINTQPQTLLQSLKSDILSLNDQPDSFNSDDTIQILACHNRLREVEIIKDTLMQQLEFDTNLKPEEVIVVAPDINKYVEAIRATFECDLDKNDSVYIPFHIDRVRLIDHQYVISFMSLIQSFKNEMSANNIYELLSHPSLLKKINLTEEELPRIKNWIMKSNIRQFYSVNHKKQLGLDEKIGNTWQFGENRWLSGYLGGETDDNPFLSSFGDFSGQEQLFSRLFTFLNLWFDYSALMQKNYSAMKWYELIQKLCKEFLYNDLKEDYEAKIFKQLHSKLVQKSLGIEDELPLQVIIDIIENVITESNYRSEGQIGVRFQTWENAFIVDAKLLIVMGLNDGEFPQQETKNDIDIFNNKIPRLNKSTRQRDKNLLLSALTESTENVIFSYIGFNEKTNERQPPSVLLAELYSYLHAKTNQVFSIVEHKMHGFNKAYYHKEGLIQQSYNPNYYHLSQQFYGEKTKQCVTQIMLNQKRENHLSLTSLQNFFKDPLNYFLSAQAHINNSIYADILKDEESYHLDGLEKWQLINEIFHHGIGTALKTGIISDNSLGELQLKYYENSLQSLEDKQAELNITPKNIEYKVADITIFGTVNIDDSLQLVSVYPHQAKSKLLLDHWIKHLCYPSNKCSYLYFQDKTFEVMPVRDSLEILTTILHKWQQSFSQPWLFLPHAYFRILSKGIKINTTKTYNDKFKQSKNSFPSEGQLYFKNQVKCYTQDSDIELVIEPIIESFKVIK